MSRIVFFVNSLLQFVREKKQFLSMLKNPEHARHFSGGFLTNGASAWFSTAHFDNSLASKSKVIFAIHKIDPAVDKEREKIKEDLLKTNKVKKIEEFQIVEPSAGTNSAGNMFFTDGKAEIIYLA